MRLTRDVRQCSVLKKGKHVWHAVRYAVHLYRDSLRFGHDHGDGMANLMDGGLHCASCRPATAIGSFRNSSQWMSIVFKGIRASAVNSIGVLDLVKCYNACVQNRLLLFFWTKLASFLVRSPLESAFQFQSHVLISIRPTERGSYLTSSTVYRRCSSFWRTVQCLVREMDRSGEESEPVHQALGL
jgi:hypothetical protein